jgi:hypothetical protein
VVLCMFSNSECHTWFMNICLCLLTLSLLFLSNVFV